MSLYKFTKSDVCIHYKILTPSCAIHLFTRCDFDNRISLQLYDNHSISFKKHVFEEFQKYLLLNILIQL